MNPLRHVAIIMDGNGRWGTKKNNNRNLGHKEALKVIEKIVYKSISEKISFLTLYTFSTENWKRPDKEVNFLFNLLKNFLIKRIKKLHNDNICLKFIGSKKKLKKDLLEQIRYCEKLTAFNNKIKIIIALNYGSQDEIIYASKQLEKKKLKFTRNNFENNLYTKNIPHPDILIRTGNTNRLSNFLLWQLAYTEIYFEKKLWPDFTVNDFNRIIKLFKKTRRNFGGIVNE
jgi:undecaprenyl diphosphate synthase